MNKTAAKKLFIECEHVVNEDGTRYESLGKATISDTEPELRPNYDEFIMIDLDEDKIRETFISKIVDNDNEDDFEDFLYLLENKDYEAFTKEWNDYFADRDNNG